MKVLKKIVDVLGSFWLASIVLILLMVLTLAGTLEQGRSTLYDVQTNYFANKGFLIHYWGGKYPMPLAGGYLLLGVLFVNLLIGGILRMRWGKSTLGILITHFGIILLLVGGFVEERLARNGSVQVWEPRPASDTRHIASDFKSAQEWEVAVARVEPDGSKTEFIVPDDAFADRGSRHVTRATRDDLPFDVVLSGYVRNGRVKRLPPARAAEGVGGEVLEEVPPVDAKAAQRTRNVPGLYVVLEEKEGDGSRRGILSGMRKPLAVGIGSGPDRTSWTIDLRPRTWSLPFKVSLDEFVHEFHPGTGMPRRFSSYVTVTEDRGGVPVDRKVHITMNEPLRHEGYTLYQSGWGPQDRMEQRKADGRMYSDFSVVNNPSDHLLLGVPTPIWACAIIALGLLLHYVRRFIRYLNDEAERSHA